MPASSHSCGREAAARLEAATAAATQRTAKAVAVARSIFAGTAPRASSSTARAARWAAASTCTGRGRRSGGRRRPRPRVGWRAARRRRGWSLMRQRRLSGSTGSATTRQRRGPRQFGLCTPPASAILSDLRPSSVLLAGGSARRAVDELRRAVPRLAARDQLRAARLVAAIRPPRPLWHVRCRLRLCAQARHRGHPNVPQSPSLLPPSSSHRTRGGLVRGGRSGVTLKVIL